ncbi:retrovirus-related pol polyprotein from transposon TNT 1-94 [Tanacetum coccineum]
MLATTSLGKSFWAEAVNTACYVINRSPSTAVELKTPMEMWTGKPVDYSDLHIFGSPVYVMYNTQETTKLDPKSRKCLFLGYADGVKGYRLWDPTAHKVVVSRDVVFMEDKVQENEESDSTTRETTTIQMEKEFQSNDSSEAVPQHEVNETTESQAPTTRTSDRERRRPGWQSDYVMESNVAYCLLTEEGEPSTLQEALNNPDASFWKEAMQEEIEALHKNKTWELVPLPGGRKPIGNKWVYKIKRNGDDQVERYRARLVVKGYAQKEGIDFNEIFSPVVRITTIRVVLAMCATYDLHLEQLDVKTAFLHGNLDEEIYMLQPEGFEQKGKENLVCRLNKSLYGLKQAPRCWYKRFDSFIIGLGYNRLHADPCAYFKRFGNNDFVILLLYVDDMLVAGPNKDRISKLKAQLAREFEMKDLGPANKILGMQIHRDRVSRKIWLSQKSYVKKILQRFNMQDCKPISTPFPTNIKLSSKMSPSSEKERMEMSRVPYASAVGSLMFAMICTRPDIAHAVGVVSRYMAKPGREHWGAVKRILRYIKGTSDVALCYGESGLTVKGYVDSDYAGDLDGSKSTTGYVFTLSDRIVSWVSKLQSVVAMSTMEAEYVAAAQTSKEAVWLKMLLEELGHEQDNITLFCDNQSTLYLARNPNGYACHASRKEEPTIFDYGFGIWRIGRYLFKDMDGLRDVIGSQMLSVAGTWIILTLTCCGMRCLLLLIRKVEELAEDNIVEFDWLVSLLTEVVETKFDWISKNGEKWMIHDNEGTTDQQIYCISKNGGYLTANMVNSLTYLISRMESAIVSTGFTLNRYAVDYKKVTNSALQAIKELEALVEQKWHSYEDFDQLDEEYQARSSNNSVEDDDC